MLRFGCISNRTVRKGDNCGEFYQTSVYIHNRPCHEQSRIRISGSWTHFPSHYHAWVTIDRTPTKTTYIFEAFYPDLTFEDFDTIYVPDTAYDHETDILAAYEKRMLYIRAQGEIQTLFRIPQDADIREITARWCAERNVLSIRLPRLVQHVCGETVIRIEVD